MSIPVCFELKIDIKQRVRHLLFFILNESHLLSGTSVKDSIAQNGTRESNVEISKNRCSLKYNEHFHRLSFML